MVFLKAMELGSATSTDLFAALQKIIFAEYGVTKEQFCCLNTDWASALSGIHFGLQTLSKNEYAWLVWIHCVAHRLQLAIKNELQEDKEHRLIETKFQSLRKFIHDSAKSWKALYTLSGIFNDSKKSFVGMHKVRWLSVHKALDNILGKLFSILEDLRQIQAEKKGDAMRKASAWDIFCSGRDSLR